MSNSIHEDYAERCNKCNKPTDKINRCWVFGGKTPFKSFMPFCLKCAEWAIKEYGDETRFEEFQNYIKSVEEYLEYDPDYRKRLIGMGYRQLHYNYCTRSTCSWKWSLQFFLEDRCGECNEQIRLEENLHSLVDALDPNHEPYKIWIQNLSEREIISKIISIRDLYINHRRIFDYTTDDDIILSDDPKNIDELIRKNIVIKKLYKPDDRVLYPTEKYFIKIND